MIIKKIIKLVKVMRTTWAVGAYVDAASRSSLSSTLSLLMSLSHIEIVLLLSYSRLSVSVSVP